LPNRGGYESTFKFNEQFSSKKPLKIGYFADGIWSHEAFKKLVNDNEISIQFICVRFDTKDEVLLNFAKKYSIDYLKHENINSKEFIEKIKQYSCDLFVSMSFNQIFKNEIINLVSLKTINCHAGKLPFYRGRNILNWALINDEKEFGITVHYIDEGIDTGDIILQNSYLIRDEDSYKTLLERAYEDCADILYRAINMFKKGIPLAIKQKDINPIGFYCSQRKEGDEILNWNQTSREIFNFVRATCCPAPMARAVLNGIEMKINKVEYIENAPKYKCVVGTILNKEEDSSFLVKTQDTFVKITEYEYDGKIKIGDRFDVK
jgi:methionyl-tRNA formyltransferase